MSATGPRNLLRGIVARLAHALATLWPILRNPRADASVHPLELVEPIEALRLEHWLAHVAPRLSVYELSHLRESPILPQAARAIAHLLDSAEIAQITASRRARRLTEESDRLSRDNLARYAQSLSVHAQADRRTPAAIIARRASSRALRPLSPRAPALARLT